MAITVKYLEDLGVEKEVAEKIFAERSKEIEADKAKRADVETKLKEAEKNLESLTTEIDTLKTSGKNAEEIQAKLDALIAEREAEKTKAEADRIAKEKAESLDKRFEAVVGDKKFSHEAIRADYRRKFENALADKENEGKSDADVFHALSKDDATAFTGVTAVKLQGGKPLGNGTKYTSKADIMAIKDRAERRNAIAQNLELFEKGE